MSQKAVKNVIKVAGIIIIIIVILGCINYGLHLKKPEITQSKTYVSGSSAYSVVTIQNNTPFDYSEIWTAKITQYGYTVESTPVHIKLNANEESTFTFVFPSVSYLDEQYIITWGVSK